MPQYYYRIRMFKNWFPTGDALYSVQYRLGLNGTWRSYKNAVNGFVTWDAAYEFIRSKAHHNDALLQLTFVGTF